MSELMDKDKLDYLSVHYPEYVEKTKPKKKE